MWRAAPHVACAGVLVGEIRTLLVVVVAADLEALEVVAVLVRVRVAHLLAALHVDTCESREAGTVSSRSRDATDASLDIATTPSHTARFNKPCGRQTRAAEGSVPLYVTDAPSDAMALLRSLSWFSAGQDQGKSQTTSKPPPRLARATHRPSPGASQRAQREPWRVA